MLTVSLCIPPLYHYYDLLHTIYPLLVQTTSHILYFTSYILYRWIITAGHWPCIACSLPFGPIVDVRILMDNKTGETRGAGFVEFEEVDDAAEALFNMEGMSPYSSRLHGVPHSVLSCTHPQNGITHLPSPQAQICMAGHSRYE